MPFRWAYLPYQDKALVPTRRVYCELGLSQRTQGNDATSHPLGRSTPSSPTPTPPGTTPQSPPPTPSAAPPFGPHRLELHEPRPEQRPRQPLQRGVHAPVQLDLVVQRTQDGGDGALFGEGRERNRMCFKLPESTKIGVAELLFDRMRCAQIVSALIENHSNRKSGSDVLP